MTEAFFYHLQRQPLESALPRLLEMTLSRGWKAVVQVGGEERLAALDDHLWTYSDDGFLPHVVDSETDAGDNPVVLTASDANPNGAQVRFLVDGAELPADPSPYDRLVLLFDGDDPEALAAARGAWTKAKGLGLAVAYHQQDAHGRWEKKA